MQSISVKHNIEVAHRLFDTPGKCENIHGHSMWVTLTMSGRVNHAGMVAGLDFGDVKKSFRDYLDSQYDHHLLLNESDPFAGQLVTNDEYNREPVRTGLEPLTFSPLPGLMRTAEDPTTENIAKWIGEYFRYKYNLMETGIQDIEVLVQETHVNFACWKSTW